MLFEIQETITKDFNRLWKKGAVHITSSRWLVSVISILQRIILARVIGVESIGHIAVIRSSMTILQIPAGLGMYSPTNKLTAENSENKSIQIDILSSVFWFILITSFAISIISFYIIRKPSSFFHKDAQSVMLITVFLLPFLTLTQIMNQFLAGQQKMKMIAKLELFFSFLGLFTVWELCHFFQFSGWTIYYTSLTTFIFITYLYYVKTNIRFSFNYKLFKKIFKIGFFAFLGQSVGIILLQIDTLSINGIMKDAEATGIYNTSAIAYQHLMKVVSGILFTTFPYVAKNKHDLPLLLKRYKELSFKLFTLSLITCVVAWFAAPLFFSIFGPEFIASIVPFRILLLAFLCQVQYFLINCFLVALGRTDLTFITGLMTTVLNLVLNFLFIQKWGLIGAAWATVISLLVTLIIRQIALQYFIFYKRAYN